MRQLRDAIEDWETRLARAHGRDAYIIKKALIEMRRDQYIIKNAYRRPIIPTKITRTPSTIPLNSQVIFYKETATPYGLSLLDWKVCSAILCNYSALKEESWDKFNEDTWYIIYDFERICDKGLADYPLYQRLMEYKIDGLTNIKIQEALETEFGIRHSIEYISSLWRNKIPKLIASAAEDEFLNWYYLNIEKGKYKRCSRCGQIKLAHNKYFSKNNTSRDGFYSICKKCRNAKRRKICQQ